MINKSDIQIALRREMWMSFYDLTSSKQKSSPPAEQAKKPESVKQTKLRCSMAKENKDNVTNNDNSIGRNSNIKIGTYSIDHFIDVCFVRGNS